MNKCVSTSLPFVSQDDLLSLKPDVMLLKGSNCVIAEVSCPYDLYANEVYDEKRKKYAALSEEIECNGFRCSVKPVSLYHWFNRFSSQNGLATFDANGSV